MPTKKMGNIPTKKVIHTMVHNFFDFKNIPKSL